MRRDFCIAIGEAITVDSNEYVYTEVDLLSYLNSFPVEIYWVVVLRPGISLGIVHEMSKIWCLEILENMINAGWVVTATCSLLTLNLLLCPLLFIQSDIGGIILNATRPANRSRRCCAGLITLTLSWMQEALLMTFLVLTYN